MRRRATAVALTTITAGALVGCVLRSSEPRRAPEPAAPPPRSPVERAIAYHGGRLYESTETSLEICSRSGCFQVTAAVDGGRYDYRVEGEVRGTRRRVEATNERLRLFENGAERFFDDEDEQAYRDWAMARIYFAFLPYRLADPSVRGEDMGTESWHGRPLSKVKVTFAAGSSTDADDEYLYWFDPATGRLEQFAYSYSGSPGGLRYRRLFNYRRVGGILFADQRNYGVDSEGLAVEQVTARFVAERMELVSTVRLHHIEVRSLARSAPGVPAT